MLEYDKINIPEGIDISTKMHQKSVIFVIIGIFQIKTLNMNHIFATASMI